MSTAKASILILIRRLAFGAFVCACLARPLEAQALRTEDASYRTWLIGNMVIAGATAGIGALISHRPVLKAFAIGAAAGAGVFVGKLSIATEGPVGAWGGRQIAAISSSVVANTMLGRKPFEEVVIPVGLVRLYITPATGKVQPSLDFAGVVSTVAAARRPGTTFDAKESLRNGAIVFKQPWTSDPPGNHVAGVLRIDDIPREVPRNGNNYVWPAVVSHELIHASQYDFVSIAWSKPLERAFFNRTAGGRTIVRYVDLGSMVPVWMAMNQLISPADRPWEREAQALAPGQ